MWDNTEVQGYKNVLFWGNKNIALFGKCLWLIKIYKTLTTVNICLNKLLDVIFDKWCNIWCNNLLWYSIMLIFYDSLVENTNFRNIMVFQSCFAFFLLTPWLSSLKKSKSYADIFKKQLYFITFYFPF